MGQDALSTCLAIPPPVTTTVCTTAWSTPLVLPGHYQNISDQTVLSRYTKRLLLEIMEFSSNQEDIYNKLVNTKNKYGKAVQVKYELTRPRKKQKKKGEAKMEIVAGSSNQGEANSEQENLNLDQEQTSLNIEEDVYCVPPEEIDENSSSDEELSEAVSAPVPPPRTDSLIPEVSQDNNERVKGRRELKNGAIDKDCSSINNNEAALDDDVTANQDNPEGIYAPCNWRQQNYESWTPFFTPAVQDNPPPPTQPPPKPPAETSSQPTPVYAVSSKASKKSKKDYEEWQPLNKDPPPPSQPPPQPPSQVQQPQSAPQSAPGVPGAVKPVLTGKKFIQTPKQITGLKKLGTPTPFLAAAAGDNLLRPSRPAPKPPTISSTSTTSQPSSSQTSSTQITTEQSSSTQQSTTSSLTQNTPIADMTQQQVPDNVIGDIRLSPIKDSLPEPDADRLYEPCNWRRQIKDDLDEEMYGAMEDIMPRPRSPSPLGGSVAFARAPLRKSKSILKEKKQPTEGEEKKKKVRMLFPVDTVTPI